MTRPESALSLVQRVALLCGPTETVEQPRQLAAEILGEIARHGCVEAVTALRDALNDSLDAACRRSTGVGQWRL